MSLYPTTLPCPWWEEAAQEAITARHAREAALTHSRPTVSEVLDVWGPWDCCMALMGVCEDSFPLSARLYDPQRGRHYLFYGQDNHTLAALVEPILYSMTVQRFGPEKWAFAILSDNSTEWTVADSPYCKTWLRPYQRDASELIPAMAGLAEQRSMGRHRGPLYVVVLHDLGRLWPRLDPVLREDIFPLLRTGHLSGIHVFATLRYEDYDKVPAAVRRAFPQKLYGYAAKDALPNTTAFRNLPNLLYYDLTPYQAFARIGGEWMRYTAPRLG